MLKISDPIRLVGRSVTVRTVDGGQRSGTLCSAGLGGVLLDIDGSRVALRAGDVDSLEAEAVFPETVR